MAAVLPLIKIVLTHLMKNVLLPLGLSAGMSAADVHIQKKIYGSGCPLDLALHTIKLTISNEAYNESS